jgi:hypothetical protein
MELVEELISSMAANTVPHPQDQPSSHDEPPPPHPVMAKMVMGSKNAHIRAGRRDGGPVR